MSNRMKLKRRTEPVQCDTCGLKFATATDREWHWKALPDGRGCLSVRSMTGAYGFYRTRGAWRLPG